MKKIILPLLLCVSFIPSAMSAEPVYDEKNHTTAKEIKQSNETIKQFLEKVNEALKGSRRSDVEGVFSKAGLGGMSSVLGGSGFSSILSGGSLNLSSLGLSSEAQTAASTMINGLGLATSIASAFKNGDKKSALDQVYSTSVNLAASLAGISEQTSRNVKQRRQDFESVTAKIGDAEDMKGSLDQNSAIQAQTGQTINEMIGVQNAGLAAQANQLQQQVTRQSAIAQFVEFDESTANPFKNK